MTDLMINPNIRKLNLSGKLNGVIPEYIYSLKNLQKLNISNCGLKQLPTELSKLKRLESLDVSNNNISNLYAKLFELKKLKVLILNNNKLSSIPKQISNLKELKIFSVANNRLVSISESISELDCLEELNISKNDFTFFPIEITLLKGLRKLWIGDNRFDNFPLDKIYRIPKLNALYCYSSVKSSNLKIDKYYNSLSRIRGNSINSLDNLMASMKKTIEDIKLEKKDNKVKIFISYSHDDNPVWINRVKRHLKVLHLEDDNFDVWDDTIINSGTKWKDEIEKSLNECRIAILMISTNFLASDFIINNELPQLLKSAETKGTLILPLIVAPSRFLKNKNLSIFQSVNNPAKPLSDLTESEQDKILIKLVDDVEDYINKIK